LKSYNWKKFVNFKKGKLKHFKSKLKTLKYGFIGLKALESGTLKTQQIDSIRSIILKNTKNKIKIWRRKLNCVVINKKPIGIRMGKGVGKITTSVFKINGGDIILEFCCINNKVLIPILNSYKFKLPIKVKIVYKT
jgi:ribosomal protein L16